MDTEPIFIFTPAQLPSRDDDFIQETLAQMANKLGLQTARLSTAYDADNVFGDWTRRAYVVMLDGKPCRLTSEQLGKIR